MKSGRKPRRRRVSWFGTVRMRLAMEYLSELLRRTVRDNPSANAPPFARIYQKRKEWSRWVRPEQSSPRAAWGKTAWASRRVRLQGARPGARNRRTNSDRCREESPQQYLN